MDMFGKKNNSPAGFVQYSEPKESLLSDLWKEEKVDKKSGHGAEFHL